MKALIILATSILVLTPFSGHGQEKMFTSRWLRQGLEITIKPVQFTSEAEAEAHKGLEVMCWLQGFYNGALAMSMVPGAPETRLYQLPNGWTMSRVYTALYNFIQKHGNEIKDQSDAGDVVRAWLFMEHPDATVREAQQGEFILKLINRPG